MFFFFFQAEDGIRDYKVTGVQTCALPIFFQKEASDDPERQVFPLVVFHVEGDGHPVLHGRSEQRAQPDRKSTRLNSSHLVISYAVFCLKKKKIELIILLGLHLGERYATDD